MIPHQWVISVQYFEGVSLKSQKQFTYWRGIVSQKKEVLNQITAKTSILTCSACLLRVEGLWWSKCHRRWAGLWPFL